MSLEPKWNIVKSMGGAIGFIADKELVVCPWEKKPDVELVDPTGELLTIYLDVTLRALHQEAIKSRTDVLKRAREGETKVIRARTNTGASSQSRLAFHLL